jgi:hypothetical protein
MEDKEKRVRIFRYLFAIFLIVSIALILSNYEDFSGLLESRNKVIFTINEVTHRLDNDKVEITIPFSILNPTSYTRVKFSSLQCQIYLIVDGNEEFIGVAGYSPPFDVPLPSDEIRIYTTRLSVSKDNIFSLTGGDIGDEIEWKIQNVVHYSTPISEFYQNLITIQISRHQK